MKKVLPTLLFLFMMFNGSSQFYARIGGGYGFTLAPFTQGYSSTPNSYGVVNKSHGRGISLGIHLGYFVKENALAFQLDFNYLLGTTITTHSTKADVAYESSMIRISPSCKIVTGENLQAYARFGPVLGVNAKLIETYTSMQSTRYIIEYTGGLSVGISAGLGLSYKVTDHFTVYTEAGAIGQNWAPKKSVMTKYIDANGNDMSGVLSVNQKETEYVESYDPNTIIGPGSPAKGLKFYLPFSSWGLNAGLSIFFGAGSSKTVKKTTRSF